MKVTVVVIGLSLLGAVSAHAIDVQGKWGIGAGVFGGGGEVSLIRGKSERSAWLLEAQVSASNTDARTEPPGAPAVTSNRNTFSIALGPGLRRFTRPGAEFSPYFDLSMRGSFGREHLSASVNSKDWGASGDLRFGLEYFTRWHVSLAAHTSLIGLKWRSRRLEGSSGFVDRATSFSVTAGLNPALFLRAYF